MIREGRPAAVDVRAVGDLADQELRSLLAWLADESEIRRAGGVRPKPGVPRQGALGALEVVELVVSSGVDVATLVLAVVSWRRTRPRGTSVMIRRGDVEVTVTTDDADTVARLVRALEQGREE